MTRGERRAELACLLAELRKHAEQSLLAGSARPAQKRNQELAFEAPAGAGGAVRRA
jgi:hypothetical protein